MKFLGILLVVLVCVSIATVDGRKDHDRDRKRHTGRFESRREFPRLRPNMVHQAQQTKKANVDDEAVNSAVTSKQDEAKPKAVSNNDAKARPAGKEKRGHKKDEARHIGREDEFKHNHARRMHEKEEFHKRHHDNRKRNHPNGSRMMKKGKMSREMMLEMDMPKSNNAELKRIQKRMMKMAKHKEEKRERLRNHSQEQGSKGKAP